MALLGRQQQKATGEGDCTAGSADRKWAEEWPRQVDSDGFTFAVPMRGS